MIEVNTVVLENGVEYTEVDDLIYNNTRYVLLSNIKNVKDSCIRKIVEEDDDVYIEELDNNAEYEKILNLFVEKNKTLFN